ncbi:succinate dehydrogenase, cytochrome b556 subunit [Sphingomonas sp.]|uniref:succinate dehydrogenase, cytochrome b556 subunit n=1 Tax=Sphingomonas sp. TaxID=28214 RepID=UPI0025E73331|nr:succinate dehydrogenase, cytochrome b556 subunit [Sphingomonas sp.]
MASPDKPDRPISPHLTAYKWGPHMAVSIIHRATGTVMGTIGALVFTWWLVSLAAGPAMYGEFLDVFTYQSGKLNVVGWVFGIGFSWTLFQHMGSGVRHFFLDEGANFELKGNKASSIAAFVFGIVATLAFWILLWEKLNG